MILERTPVRRRFGLGYLGQASVTFTADQLAALGPNYGWTATSIPGARLQTGGYTDTFGVFHPQYTNQPPTFWWTAPTWFTARSRGPAVNTSNPVEVWRVSLPFGPGYWVPNSWMLNEGVQKLPAATAARYGGIELPRNAANLTGGVDNGFLFAFDPSGVIPTGLPSGAYTPGINVGRQNLITAATIAAGAGIVAAAPLVFTAAFGVPGAASAAAAAPAAAVSAAGVPTAVATGGGGILGTGVSLGTISSAVGLAKTALSQYQAMQAKAKAAAASGSANADQLAQQAEYYRQQALLYGTQVDTLQAQQPQGSAIPWLALIGGALMFLG